ncbi:MAG TPA: hypothetical protein VGM13_04545 [Thermoanaerobaculia bacterium]
MLFIVAEVFGPIGCVPVRKVNCSAVHCKPVECRSNGQSALEDGHPDLAACAFRSALAQNESDVAARLGYGSSLAIMGETGPARQQFRWAVEHSTDEGDQSLARAWLAALESPLPVAVYYRQDEGCSPNTGAGKKAAESLRRTLSRLAAFHAATGDGDPLVPWGHETEMCARAKRAMAQVALIVSVRCNRLSAARNPTFLGGMIQVNGITKYKSAVSLEVEAYHVRRRERRVYLAQEGTASNISERAAIWTAVDDAVGKVVLRLAKELLYGPS